MKLIYIYIFYLIAVAPNNHIYAQTGTIDTVFSFVPGKGQNAGQDSAHYPMNIFGPPDTLAGYLVQSSSPDQVLSIGLGGEIIVGFKGFFVEDKPGDDFTIFENAFFNPVTKKIFAEPAKVAVSQDGIKYYEFPFDSLTLVGCAGLTPTIGNKNPFDPNESGGDKFDLANLGLKYIKFIKITDICQMVLKNKNHPYYDPIISGFDLDAVVGLHLISKIPLDVNDGIGIDLVDFLRDGDCISIFSQHDNFKIYLYNYIGECLLRRSECTYEKIYLNNYNYNIFFIRIETENNNEFIKIYK
ncbi:MAG: hypothetical protein NT007_04145 [Candidatus Kapabacteria bacterium]|nr:hypothetical protein [Candidatus Kapabacteria bacterium]